MSAGVAPPPIASLSNDEILRYSRHLIMPEVGMEGQLKLKNASVLLVGTGGLGAPLGMYLAACGRRAHRPGRFRRGRFHQSASPDHPRDERRRPQEARFGRRHDCATSIRTSRSRSTTRCCRARTRWRSCANYDLIIDGTDNFPTRYLVNDACVLLKKPNVYGSIFRFEGQATVFAYPGGPCYRCLYPEPPPPGLVPSCAEGGVLGILPGTIGLIQATEAVKLILGVGEPLVGPPGAL